jgi:hypothetical protein
MMVDFAEEWSGQGQHASLQRQALVAEHSEQIM